MFAITHRRGFHMTFANGYTVSVQFGFGQYCEARNTPNANESKDAEIAVWPSGGELMRCDGSGDTVRGWQSPEAVARLIDWAARIDPAMPPASVPDFETP